MNAAAKANPAIRPQPISRDLEKALHAFIENLDELSAHIDDIADRDENNVIQLHKVCADTHAPSQSLLKILNKYITNDGEYIGPRNFSIIYKGEPLLFKAVAGQLDGFAWLSGILKIGRSFDISDGATFELKFGN